MKLVVCEKNIAASRIAYILSNGKSKKKSIGRTPVYHFKKEGEEWKIVGLRGHIVHLDYPKKYNKWQDIPPQELIDIEPEKKVSQKSIANALKKLVDSNSYIIVATDYDREGELIGVEAIDLLKKYNKDVKSFKRAKFSSITGYEINNAFEKMTDVDFNLSAAGESRQIIDLIWGAVLTRFISLASKRYGKRFLSIGRVQSPTLAILVEREKEIKNFTPKPFWKIIAKLHKNKDFKVIHQKNKFWDEKEVNSVFEKIKDTKEASVEKVEKKKINERPPSPFNTTTFLRSASYLGVSASKAMSTAEELYMSGYISYPRTDNTVYPRSLNINKILDKLSKGNHSKQVEIVEKNRRKYPTRGKKKTTDHPPIHPVGSPKGRLKGDKRKIYDLIVRRFLSTLTQDALAETTDIIIDIKNEKFKGNGYKQVKPTWKNIYTFFKKKNKPLPELKEGEKIKISNIDIKKDKTKPPKRYTQGSLISKMEKLSLGTKSTRHGIIKKLYQRKYITFSPLAPRPIAMAVIEALKGCDVIKPKMTAELEKDMNLIAEGKKTLKQTIEESREMLNKVIEELKKDKDEIRENIKHANKRQNTIGKCPNCGKNLVIRKSNKNNKRFIGCTGYPDCKTTYPLPQKGGVRKTNRKCKKCDSPYVKILRKGKKPWWLCINPDCPSKKNNKK
ncbi:MAG: DNA topoisomerase I [Candidatus Thermoplasmatota archaeon]